MKKQLKIFFIFILFIILLFSFSCVVFGATYVVDNTNVVSRREIFFYPDNSLLLIDNRDNSLYLISSTAPFVFRGLNEQEFNSCNVGNTSDYFGYCLDFGSVTAKWYIYKFVNYSYNDNTNTYTNNDFNPYDGRGNNSGSTYNDAKSYQEIGIISVNSYSDIDLSRFTKVAGSCSLGISLNYPFITNTEQVLSTGTFDYLTINCADFVGDKWQDFYLLCYDYSNINEDVLDIYPRKEIKLEGGLFCKYYSYASNGAYILMLPKGDLGLDFRSNCNYAFKLATTEPVEFEGQTIDAYRYFYEQKFTVLDLTADQQLQNSQDRTNSQLEEQTQAIKEQTETNKGILGTIGNIISFLNPFSENFFAYKLLDLLYEGLKALFIPDDDFFANWFMELNDTFAEQFGILYYPVGCTIEFLQALEPNLTNHEPIIHIPEFSFSFFGANATFLHETTYNLNDVLQNEKFANIHRFYLFFVDVILTIGVISYASKIFIEIFGGVDTSVDTQIESMNNSPEKQYQRAYDRYARNQAVKREYIRRNNQ